MKLKSSEDGPTCGNYHDALTSTLAKVFRLISKDRPTHSPPGALSNGAATLTEIAKSRTRKCRWMAKRLLNTSLHCRFEAFQGSAKPEDQLCCFERVWIRSHPKCHRVLFLDCAATMERSKTKIGARQSLVRNSTATRCAKLSIDGCEHERNDDDEQDDVDRAHPGLPVHLGVPLIQVDEVWLEPSFPGT